MKPATRLMNWIGAGVIAATMVACSAEAQRDASEAGNKAAKAAEKTGEAAAQAAKDATKAVGGAFETMDVKLALTTDKRVDASNINVDTDQATKTVTLKGRVPTEEQRRVAQEIATAKAVGYRVRNELTIGK